MRGHWTISAGVSQSLRYHLFGCVDCLRHTGSLFVEPIVGILEKQIALQQSFTRRWHCLAHCERTLLVVIDVKLWGNTVESSFSLARILSSKCIKDSSL